VVAMLSDGTARAEAVAIPSNIVSGRKPASNANSA